jgi:hypothetical protein
LENPNFFSHQRQTSIKTTTTQRLSDRLEKAKLGNFYGRDRDMGKLEEMFKRFQYVILRGKKGDQKSFYLSEDSAYRTPNESSFLFISGRGYYVRQLGKVDRL